MTKWVKSTTAHSQHQHWLMTPIGTMQLAKHPSMSDGYTYLFGGEVGSIQATSEEDGKRQAVAIIKRLALDTLAELESAG